MFAPQVMDFFSIPLTDRRVTKFFRKIFQETVAYRQSHNVIRHDFMNLLMQLMEKGYVEADDEKDVTDESRKYRFYTML